MDFIVIYRLDRIDTPLHDFKPFFHDETSSLENTLSYNQYLTYEKFKNCDFFKNKSGVAEPIAIQKIYCDFCYDEFYSKNKTKYNTNEFLILSNVLSVKTVIFIAAKPSRTGDLIVYGIMPDGKIQAFFYENYRMYNEKKVNETQIALDYFFSKNNFNGEYSEKEMKEIKNKKLEKGFNFIFERDLTFKHQFLQIFKFQNFSDKLWCHCEKFEDFIERFKDLNLEL